MKRVLRELGVLAGLGAVFSVLLAGLQLLVHGHINW